MTQLYDENFNENLDCTDDHRIIIGYSDYCDTCKRLTCMLQMKRIQYASINLTQNRKFLENLKIKINSIHVSIPAVLIYKNNEFKKMINSTLDTNEIIYERNNC
jgi:glutaredoxin